MWEFHKRTSQLWLDNTNILEQPLFPSPSVPASFSWLYTVDLHYPQLPKLRGRTWKEALKLPLRALSRDKANCSFRQCTCRHRSVLNTSHAFMTITSKKESTNLVSVWGLSSWWCHRLPDDSGDRNIIRSHTSSVVVSTEITFFYLLVCGIVGVFLPEKILVSDSNSKNFCHKHRLKQDNKTTATKRGDVCTLLLHTADKILYQRLVIACQAKKFLFVTRDTFHPVWLLMGKTRWYLLCLTLRKKIVPGKEKISHLL